MIYLDQAASSWPKPNGVAEAMALAVQEYGANPGRGGHRLARRAAETISQCRVALAKLFNVQQPHDIAFFHNATGAINQAIQGFSWHKGDHVVSTMFEHNAVRRPLTLIAERFGVEVSFIQPDHNGSVDLDQLRHLLREKTKLIVATHMSNVTGAILPITEIGRVAKEEGIPFLVDASQSAGIIPIDVERDGIDLLAFPGHKGLYGPQGTAALYIAPELDLHPLLYGGTGRFSELAGQPTQRPERYEAGTLNTPGLAGLTVGIQFILETGVHTIKERDAQLTRYALEQLESIDGLEYYGPDPQFERGPVIPFNLIGINPHEVATILDQHYEIAVRAGLHCAPLAHRTIRTENEGAIRISFGYFNRHEEIDRLIEALREIKTGLSAI